MMNKKSVWGIFIALTIGGQSLSPVLAADPDDPILVSESEFSSASTVCTKPLNAVRTNSILQTPDID